MYKTTRPDSYGRVVLVPEENQMNFIRGKDYWGEKRSLREKKSNRMLVTIRIFFNTRRPDKNGLFSGTM